MRRFLLTLVAGTTLILAAATPALACGGLLSPNGSVNLTRTTTLAAYSGGIEHYVTAFEFAGTGGAFGSIIPLPGVPTAVDKGGDWTLQRLVREVRPQRVELAADSFRNVAAAAPAEVLLEARIDALDITVLRGGAESVGEWATQNGFLLSPDAPEVLDFYATRSPIFMAARFDADAAQAKGVNLGDGTPVHLTIPTDNPWVPLRILGLGRQPSERIDADVFLLTETKPALLPGNDAPGLAVERSGAASESLLADLRSDRGMEWVPESMWLSFLRVDAAPSELTYDLAVDVSGAGKPSPLAAGLEGPGGVRPSASSRVTRPDAFPTGAAVAGLVGLGVVAALVVAGAVVVAGRRR